MLVPPPAEGLSTTGCGVSVTVVVLRSLDDDRGAGEGVKSVMYSFLCTCTGSCSRISSLGSTGAELVRYVGAVNPIVSWLLGDNTKSACDTVCDDVAEGCGGGQ